MDRTFSALASILVLVGGLALIFDIQPIQANGTIYIMPDGSIDPPTAPIQRDNDLYTFTDDIYASIVVLRDSITIDGNGCKLQGNGSGFDLSIVSSVTVMNTYIISFNDGIYIYYAPEYPTENMPVSNTIVNNTITNCTYAIFIYIWDQTWTAHLHSIIGNAITHNTYGILLSGNTRYNDIYHNNFLNNTYQAVDEGQTNYFDNGYPSGGNYWSDYDGTDLFSGPYQNETGSDGIGDTPYTITGDEDRYPLKTGTWPFLGDINNDFQVNMQDIATAATAFGSYQGHPRWNPIADIYEDDRVDLLDIGLIARNFGEKYP